MQKLLWKSKENGSIESPTEALSSAEVETSIVKNLSEEKDLMTFSVKEKYIKLLKMHKTCEKKLKYC